MASVATINRPATRELIDTNWRACGTIHLSAISAWEIALLLDAGRISLNLPADRWVRRFLDRPGLAAAPLTPAAAAGAYRLPNFAHHDPADRLLVTTALELACPLVTYDLRIIQFAHTAGRQLGFKVIQ